MKKNSRMIGLDFGSKTVGVAVSDPLGITAQPLETVTRSSENKLRRTLARRSCAVRSAAAKADRSPRAKKETRTACLFFVCSYSVTKGSRAI